MSAMPRHSISLIVGCILALCIAGLARAQATQPAASPATTTQPSAPRGDVTFTPIIHVEKRGSGPIAMVLIPGLACDWTVFDSFMQRNQDRYTMYAVTLPGFGGTEPPPTPPDGVYGAWIDNALKGLWKVVDDNQIDNLVFVGHSLGGHLALRLGCEPSRRVRAIISLDGRPVMPLGTPNMTPEARQAATRSHLETYRMFTPESWPLIMRQMVSMMVSDPKRGAELGDLCARPPRDVTLHYMTDLFVADATDELFRLSAPAMVIAAVPTADITPPMAQQYRDGWRATLQNAPHLSLVFFEKTRHFIQDERPAELDAAIADFLAGRSVQGVQADPVPQTAPATVPALPR